MEKIVNFRIKYLISACMVIMSGSHFGQVNLASAKPAKNAVLLEIIDGDTAFIVDEGKNAAWWVVGQCLRPIPVKPRNSSNNTMTSEEIRTNSRIGDRQIALTQQFRFTLADTPNGPITAEVYNSLRGGWSAVPVRQIAQCEYHAYCRLRLESPEC